MAEFPAKTIDIAVPRLRQTEKSKSDLSPILDQRLKVNLKYALERSRIRELSNAASRGSVRPLVLEKAGGGATRPPPGGRTEIAQAVPGNSEVL